MSSCAGRLVWRDRWGREGRAWQVPRGVTVLGRHPACEVRLLHAAVEPRHATLAAHHHQTVVRNEGAGVTLVNGRAVTVAALRHGDVITVADRHLRWEYHRPHADRDESSRRGRRSAPAATDRAPAVTDRTPAVTDRTPAVTDRTLQLALEMRHRASAPGSTGGKQVAIVQPQRRDNNGQGESRSAPTSPARRSVESPLQSTKASLWIESRKSGPGPRRTRRSAPSTETSLRMTVLRRAQTAAKLIKIEAPLEIDHTKQAAIMLMTGHTPKSKLSINPKNRSSTKKSPSYVVRKSSPVRKTRAKSRPSGRNSARPGAYYLGVTPSRGSTFAQDSSNSRSSKRNSGNRSVTVLEITDSTQDPTIRASDISTRSNKSLRKPLSLSSPKKSAMKDHSKKNTRKTESIKFDLSNLESRQESDEEMMLRYSESSEHSTEGSHSRSRSGKLHRTGASNASTKSTSTLTPRSPRARKSIRGNTSVQKKLESTTLTDYTDSDRSLSTIASAFRTRTLSPRPDRNLESYSVVDLISFDSRDTSKSVYNSAGSTDTSEFGTPPSGGRRTRSTIHPTLLGSSTPYVGGTGTTRSKSSSNLTRNERSAISTRRSKSLSTPENRHISVNSTKVSRASRSRSRINDSDLLLDDTEAEDASPKTSKRSRTTKSFTKDNTNVNSTAMSPESPGMTTPENRYSPEAVGTPVLSIQSLLNSSQSSLTSQYSGRRGRSVNSNRRKTIGAISEPRSRQGLESKSIGASVRKTRLRLSRDSGDSDRTDEGTPQPDNEDTVTPKSAVKISPEDVKNKHSTAKKPQSKRSIIDDLNRSDIVKQLFNSPVKRKLSQSMTEFSRKQLFDDDDAVLSRRPTRNTIALTGRSPEYSILDQTEAITPERFVSPIGSSNSSPSSSGLERFQATTPRNDSRNSRRVKSLLPSPRARGSIRNDLSNVEGVKAVFAKSSRNRLSDVRAKEAFAVSPQNDLRRVSGVKSLFRASPKNDLTDVRGVKRMFKRKSPENDLRNVSGVKRTLRNAAPRNDLTDVRGVRRLFRQEKRKRNYHDVSGVEELFNESDHSGNRSERLFDMLAGKPPIKSVYSKTFTAKTIRKPRTRRTGSLRRSIDVITNNVEEWLEQELQRRLQKNETSKKTTKELQKLATDTVEGEEPIVSSRTRNSFAKKSASEIYSAHMLPIKKRSLVQLSADSARRLATTKRALHSTPVKTQHYITLNGSELGRVSPITADVAALGSTRMIAEEGITSPPPKARTPRKQETPKKFEISKPSPQKSPEKLILPKRSTRNRKNAETSRTKTRKSRNSLVVPKKAPVMTPKPGPKVASRIDSKDLSTASPKKTRAARGKKEQKIVTPKTTRTRATKVTVVVAKSTPKLKPKPKEKVAEKSQAKVQGDKPNKTRKTTAVGTKDSQKVSPKNIRKARGRAVENEVPVKGRTTKPKTSVDISQIKKPSRAKRGRKTIVTEIEQPVLQSKRRKTNAVESNVLENTKTRRGKASVVADSKTEQKQPKGRGKKTEIQVSLQPESKTRGRGKKMEPIAETQSKTRGKKVAFELDSEEKPRKTRNGKKVGPQTSVISEPVTRSRRNRNDTISTETKGRKRKAVADEEVPSKIAKVETKGGKKAETATTGIQKRAVTKSGKVENSKQEAERSTRGTRSRQVQQVKSPVRKETKPGRGRKAAEPQEKVVETTKRKRKANAEPSPAKAAKKPATVKQVPSPNKASTRQLRGKPTEVSAAGGRSRRR